VSNAALRLDQAIENYLTEVEETRKIRIFHQYRREISRFRSHCNKRYVSGLNRGDAMRFFFRWRKEIVGGKPLKQKAINQRVIILLHAMRSQGAVILKNKSDWPKIIAKKVEIYQPEELNRFSARCTPEERLIFQVFLCIGFRECEVATLARSDIHWKEDKIAVYARVRAHIPHNITVPHRPDQFLVDTLFLATGCPPSINQAYETSPTCE
jgi:integrase